VSEKKRAGVGDADPLYLKKTTTNGSSDTPLKLPNQARRRSARIVRGATNELEIYDGRDCCGFIRPSGENYLALTADRRTVGVFPSLREALAAIGCAAS
jgi:hypothetical protein